MKLHSTFLLLSLTVVLGGATVVNAEEVSTCFTYQGQLRNNNGALVNTPQDFRVTLYPQATGGGAVGNPSVNQSNCVPVVNGLFTLTLCFGDPSSYRCEARWLEIAVRRCGSGASFQVLTQRVQLLPTPYAIQSLSACTVESNGVSSGALQDGAVTGTKIADGTIASAKVNASTFGTTFWKMDGNAGSTGDANFLGTTDNQPLELKVYGARALRLQPHGAGNSSLIGGYFQNSVGGAPGAVIAGGGTQGSINTVEGDYGFVGAGHGAHAGNQAAVVGGADNSALGQFSFVGTGLENTNLGRGSVIVGGSKNLVMTLGQNAVIGGGQQNTSSGEHATVPGGFRNNASGAVSFAAGNRAKANHRGTFVWADSQNADFPSSENDEFSIRAAGGVRMVGAGLVSTGTENGVQGNSASPTASGVYGENNGNGYGVAGRASGTGTAVYGDNPGGAGWAGYFNGRLHAAGSVGIGIDAPTRQLDVNGVMGVMDSGARTFNAGVSSEAGARLVNIGINDDLANRFGGSFDPSAQGGFLRVESRADAPLFGFFGRSSGVNSPVNQLGSITSDGTVRFEIGAGQKLSLGGNGSFEIDAPFIPGGRFVVADNGNVGIGNVNPRSRLAIGPELVGTALSSTLVTSAGSLPSSVGADIALASFGVLSGNNESLGVRARRTAPGTDWTSTAIGLTFDVDNTVQAGAGLWLGANGNVGIGTANPVTKLDVAGEIRMTVCSITSDRNAKEQFKPVNVREVLDKVARLPITEWQYKSQSDARHIGPMAQDFREAFGVGRDEKHITTIDADGVALAAIQGLNEKLEEKEAELTRLTSQNQSLIERLGAIERALGLHGDSTPSK